MELHFKKIVGVDLLQNSIIRLFIILGVRTKHPVPDGKNFGIVHIEIFVVPAVMNPVHIGSDKNFIQPGMMPDKRFMNMFEHPPYPRKSTNCNEHQRMNAKEAHPHKEPGRHEKLEER